MNSAPFGKGYGYTSFTCATNCGESCFHTHSKPNFESHLNLLKVLIPTEKYARCIFLDMPPEDPFLFDAYISDSVPMIRGSRAYVMYL